MSNIALLHLLVVMLPFLIFADEADIVYSVPSDDKVVALTFDDGPNPEVTQGFLEVLGKEDIKATFFLIGNRARQNKSLVKALFDAGHEIGNHTMDHLNLAQLDDKRKVKLQISKLQALIKNITGKKPDVFRAPFLSYDDHVFLVLKNESLRPINASVDTKDWMETMTSDEIANTVMAKIHPGAIVLMHEQARTLNALPKMISQLKEQGYEFLTVTELIGRKRE